ncbi:MAG: PepSY domain-containing protein [Actinomycetia bacterium]|nr:PepSY domain-containing protein [Actinomycetes bacterium]
MRKRTKRMTIGTCALAMALTAALVVPATPAIAAPSSGAKMISTAAMKKIAVKKAGGGKVYNIKRAYDDGRLEYDVVVVRGYKKYELEFDAYTGKLRDYDIDRLISRTAVKKAAINKVGGGYVTKYTPTFAYGDVAWKTYVKYNGKTYRMYVEADGGGIDGFVAPAGASTSNGLISTASAKNVALKAVGGGSVTRTELERDDGRWEYEITVKHNYRYHELVIDAKTGKVLDYDIDD